MCHRIHHEYRLELVLSVQGEENLFSNPCKHTHTFNNTCINIFISIYLFYQIAFAEHQKKMALLDGIGERCTGIKKIEWTASLKGELFAH